MNSYNKIKKEGISDQHKNLYIKKEVSESSTITLVFKNNKKSTSSKLVSSISFLSVPVKKQFSLPLFFSSATYAICFESEDQTKDPSELEFS